ncbi:MULTISPECIES: hypothetical protein [unclassified Acinetobacter]|uniref:hypothetical protein n=1 Tax=unclassified Acinetobacter TaxID=196816 RepID=UPI0025759520|nr:MULTISPECIES: hypothetical protein [unclassified Acinetobacter]MDM1765423.1 hypothetical protein [Acinetobacter sp. 226-1]MDM1768928.1 hypothetical protein [Acinetobacter sp. 226-4]
MKKTLLLIPLLICTSNFTFAETNSTAPVAASQVITPLVANTIRISTRPEILGLWGMEIPNNKKCVEYYNFRGGNEVVVNSGKEWSIGLFDYQPSPDNTKEKLPALIMQIKYENNQVDCSGYQENQAGEVSQYFVRWKNENTIKFCASEKEDKCFATLNRVLP